jgi:uncharacterized SAM-binding protein YcdF (DUF218 family)
MTSNYKLDSELGILGPSMTNGEITTAPCHFLENGLRLVVLATSSLTGRYRPGGDQMTADCVVAVSFGYRRGEFGETLPGASNEALAEAVARDSRGLPVIAQAEVDDALKGVRDGRGADFRVEDQHESQYFGTYEVLKTTADIMRKRGWARAMLIAHPHHVPRASAMMRNLGIEAIVPPGLAAPWDTRSQQWWTRSPASWAVRELPTVAYSAWKGWLRP